MGFLQCFWYSFCLIKFIMELNTVVSNAGSKNKVHDPLLYGSTPYLMGFSATAVHIVLNITFLVLGTIWEMESLYSDFLSVHQASIHKCIMCILHLSMYALFFSPFPNLIIATFSEVTALNPFLLYMLSPFYVIQTFCYTLQICCIENGSLASTVKNGNRCWIKR